MEKEIHEVNRTELVEKFQKQSGDIENEIKRAFSHQLDFLAKGAAAFYQSKQPVKGMLLRPYLIGLIDRDQPLVDYFRENLHRQIQAAYDMAFLREMMAALKSGTVITDGYKQALIRDSNMVIFRNNLNNQQKWSALLNVMKV